MTARKLTLAVLLLTLAAGCFNKQPQIESIVALPESYVPMLKVIVNGGRENNSFCPGDTIGMVYQVSELMHIRSYSVLADGTAYQLWPLAGMSDLKGQNYGAVYNPAMATPLTEESVEQIVVVAMPVSIGQDLGVTWDGYCQVENFDLRIFPSMVIFEIVEYTILTIDDPICADVDPGLWEPYHEIELAVPLCE